MIHVALIALMITATAVPPGSTGQAGDAPVETPGDPDLREDPGTDAARNPSDPDASSSFGEVLEVAKQRYFAGELPYARELLLGLQARIEAGEEAPREFTIEALTYLGEVLYKLDDREGAEAAFRFIFERSPDAPISPYHHPIEIVALFDVVRAEVRAEREREVLLDAPPPVVGAPPLWTFAPFGVPQFAQRRPRAALVFGGLQVGLGVASVVLYQQVDAINLPPADRNDDEAFDGITERGLRQKYFIQWPVTLAFYGVWGASVVDAQVHWRRDREATLGIGPVSRHTQGVLFHARF